jgi:transcriptional regulator with PAS, ATPase and Fis domain
VDGNFVYVNSGFVKYTETPKHVLLRTNINRIKHTFSPSIFEKVMREKKQCSMFQEIITATKKRHRQLAVGVPIFDSEGRIHFIIVTVTYLGRFNEQIQEAQKEKVSRYVATHECIAGGGERTIIGSSPEMQALLSFARKIAVTDSTCLLTGETGTGKEVLAQYIHDFSLRRNKPLVIINCAAVPDTLLESELFGYESGVFTGAEKGGRMGLIEAADGGPCSSMRSIRFRWRSRASFCGFSKPRRCEKSGGPWNGR